MRTLIIAEAGVNHNGDLKTALELVRSAAATGADIVKFQTFKAEALASSRALVKVSVSRFSPAKPL